MTEREARIVKIIANHLNIDPSTIGPNDKMIEDLGCDSLDLFEIMLSLEQEFDISDSATQDDVVANAKTMNDFFKIIEKATT